MEQKPTKLCGLIKPNPIISFKVIYYIQILFVIVSNRLLAFPLKGAFHWADSSECVEADQPNESVRPDAHRSRNALSSVHRSPDDDRVQPDNH